MAATSCTAARLAVLNALTVATGQPRALASLFLRATPAKSGNRPITTKVNKRVSVLFSEWADEPTALQFAPVITSRYTVQVECEYSAGNELFSAEDDRAKLAIEADAVDVPAALTYPGSMIYAPDGTTPTGLAGDSLCRDGYRAVVTPPRNDGTRVYTVTHTFPNVSIDITQPT